MNGAGGSRSALTRRSRYRAVSGPGRRRWMKWPRAPPVAARRPGVSAVWLYRTFGWSIAVPRLRLLVSNGVFRLRSSLRSRRALHHAFYGRTRASSLLGHGKQGAGFDVIRVYRDWRQCPKGKSGVVSNVKQAEMTGSGAGSASTLGLGLVAPFRGRAQKGSRYVCYIGASKWWSGAESRA